MNVSGLEGVKRIGVDGGGVVGVGVGEEVVVRGENPFYL
jgi:hypothetical protein